MVLGVNNYKMLCNKGSGEYNEDIIGFTPFGAWVLDGATGLNNKNLVSKESDAKWYVSWWNNFLHQNISKEKSLKNIIKEGLGKIKDEYERKINNVKLDKIDTPSSSGLFIKFHKDKIEYLLLGDCTLIYSDNERANFIKDESVSVLDERVFEYMEKVSSLKKLTLEEKKNEVMPIIIDNRIKKNTFKGYWILEFSKKAVDNGLHGYINIGKDMKIMLTSDGFSSAFDRYNIFEKEEIINIAKKQGIEYIYNKIREIENKDKKAVEFPRFKISDDSSCIYLDIYKN
ncbi:MAG: hypothetical protein RSG52_09395 [Terrisporobacter sp.]|uniref:hypothetical protein n=1 Tax=Terrisporobacter sp. TaxID=1965305 RepID=UPI002FC9A25D